MKAVTSIKWAWHDAQPAPGRTPRTFGRASVIDWRAVLGLVFLLVLGVGFMDVLWNVGRVLWGLR